MAKIHGDQILGPIFDDETDLLALAEEILELRSDADMRLWHERSHTLADRLIQLDIARSLRMIAKRGHNSPAANPAARKRRKANEHHL